ncbi:NusG domain II-containing protein [Pseudobutyrivibrio ruminis]|uniref:Uncharacterized protein n=1 Tax=Pseudobutyrivibrio ruminis DSM 9787 TaxID=1123011 RepID=A0A285SEN8_9FIRM|nr:NusG domain II-containing protein [Pseudobutyrivibrio ruminis]SOC06354.1 hypothetical protein SAMN02910411_2252 [Pseudobutyrivibrio ruminis DSM 9787]
MKKNDLKLIVTVLVVAVVFWLGMSLYQKYNTANQAYVLVTIDGVEYGKYPLNKDITERIEFEDGSYNVLEIKDGEAQISEASCPDQICVNHMHIHYSKEMIVCLPNGLIAEIVNGEERDIDGSTH